MSDFDQAAYSTAALADRLYGPKPDATKAQRRSRLAAAAAWARRKGIEPTNPGFAPLMWPVGPVDVALAKRAAMHAAGLVTPGNRTRGPVRSAAVGRSWVRRRAGDQGGVTRVDDPT